MNNDQHPTGWFEGEIVENGLTESKEGNPQVYIKIKNTDGGYDGAPMTAFLSLSEKALKWTVDKLRASGFKGFNIEDLGEEDLLAGNIVKYQVTDNEYNGETTRQIGWIRDPNAGTFRATDLRKANKKLIADALKANPPIESADDDAPWDKE